MSMESNRFMIIANKVANELRNPAQLLNPQRLGQLSGHVVDEVRSLFHTQEQIGTLEDIIRSSLRETKLRIILKSQSLPKYQLPVFFFHQRRR